MQETTFEVRIPASIVQYGFDQDEIQRQVAEWLVLTLFSEGQISSGKAATLLDIPRIDFIRLLTRRGIAYVDFSEQEIREELQAVHDLSSDTDK